MKQKDIRKAESEAYGFLRLVNDVLALINGRPGRPARAESVRQGHRPSGTQVARVMLHKTAGGRYPRRPKPAAFPVQSITVDPELLAVATQEAGGDRRRLEYVSYVKIKVHNNAAWRNR